MKKISKAISLLLAVLFIVSFAGCAKAKPVLLKYEDITFSSAQFAFALAERKGQIVDTYSNYYGYDISADASFWSTQVNDTTYAKAVEKGTLEYCKLIALTDYFCNLYGLTITDEAVIENIDKMMEKITTDFGGEDLLAISLAKYGITSKQLRAHYENYERINLLQEYWYGTNGSRKIPESDVLQSFYNNYFKVDVMHYSFYDTDKSGFKVYDDITDEQARAYFDNNYVKVQHILYMTVDTNGTALSNEEIALAKQNATEAYNVIIAGEVTFEEKSADNEDSGTEYLFTYGDMVEQFEEASFEMEVGEIRLVETKFGMHIINKLATDDEDYASKADLMKENISKERMTALANTMFEKLKSGEVAFEEGGEDAEYVFIADTIFTAGEVDEELETIVKELEIDDVYLYELVYSGVTYGYYIIKRTPLADSDISSVYATVEQELIDEAFYAYMESFFESITVNQEELDKFDVVTTVSFPFYYY